MSVIKSCEPEKLNPLSEWAPELLALPGHHRWDVVYAFEGQELEQRCVKDVSRRGIEDDAEKLAASIAFAGRTLRHYLSHSPQSENGAISVTYDNLLNQPFFPNRGRYWHVDYFENGGTLGALYLARSGNPAIEVAYGDIDEAELAEHEQYYKSWKVPIGRLPIGTVSTSSLETGYVWVSDGNVVHMPGVNELNHPVESAFLRSGIDITGESLLSLADTPSH